MQNPAAREKFRDCRSGVILTAIAVISLAFLSVFSNRQVKAAEVDFASLFGPDLTPYSLQYEASYDGRKAEAVKTLDRTESGAYQLTSFIELKILFQTLSSITETSTFTVEGGVIAPQTYIFEQSGLGSRDRSQVFDLEQGQLEARLDDDFYELSFDGSILDSLTAMLYLREQVSVGATDITFQIADKAEVENHRYQVGRTETIETPMGNFEAVRVDRIREADSPRQTTLWLLPDYGYILAAFEQIDEDDEKLELQLAEGIYGDQPVEATDY